MAASIISIDFSIYTALKKEKRAKVAQRLRGVILAKAGDPTAHHPLNQGNQARVPSLAASAALVFTHTPVAAQ